MNGKLVQLTPDMNLQQALKWAEDSDSLEAKVLSMHIRSYRLWIKEQGEFTDTCTWAMLGEICENCGCKRKPGD